MNQRKELIIKVLEKMQWHRDIAQDLLVIVKSSYCTDEILDSLINLISKSIKSTKADSEKILLEKSLQQIKRIQKMEENTKISDKDMDALLDDID